MPLIMKPRCRLAAFLVAGCALGGCHAAQPRVTREALIGSYTYVSKNSETRPTDHNLDHLVLQADGRYDLVEGGTTKPVSESKGLWTLVQGNRPNVLLDHAGYPIEINATEVRLLVDLDVGIWWSKAR
jgi:hypothetical protein